MAVLQTGETDGVNGFKRLITYGLAVSTLALWPTLSVAETIITSHAFSNFDEFKYPADFEHLDYVNPDAPKGGEIAVPARGNFDSMNPYTRKGRAGALSTIGIERIMMDTADDAYGSYCFICETLEYPESQDWVIFNLRQDVTFADGSPATAHDVVFTVELLLEQALPSFRQGVSKLYKSVEALDDYRVKFTFNEGIPRKGLISQAGATPVFSKAWFEETGARLDESRMTPSMGTGAYMMQEADPPRRIIYKRNPDYWGQDLPINRGRNNFDTIRVEYFADDTAALEAFKAGTYTFRQESNSLQWATGYDFPKINNGLVVKKELANGNLPGANGFVFNLRREKFQDRRVRQALALMYNFTWTNETLQYGLFKQRDSFWTNSDLAASGVAEGAELELLQEVADQIDPAILTDEVVSPHESSMRQLDRRNLRQAIALMEEAGYVSGDDGVLRKDGQPLEVELLFTVPQFERIFLPYVENLKRLGVRATLEKVDPSQYTNRERDFDWDVIYDGYTTGLEEGLGMQQKLGSEDAEYSLFNPAGYGTEAVDALIQNMIEAETLDGMKVAIRAIDRVLRHEQFIVPTWFNDSFWVSYYDMLKHPENMPPYSLGQLDFWWYDADRAAELKSQGAF